MKPLKCATQSMLTIFALTGLIAFSSCSKDDENTTVNPDATVKIVNALADAGSVDVYNGDSKLNSSAIGFGEATGYLNVAKGDATYNFKATLNGNTVLSSPVDFKSGDYSLFATGVAGDNTTVGVLTEDNLDAPASGKAKIRFVHVATDAPPVNFLVGDSLLNPNVGYKAASAFKEMAAGTYTIKLNNATSGETAISKTGVVLQSGKIYTVVAQGLVNATPVVEQSFQLNVLSNN
jgi:hypothetical protein